MVVVDLIATFDRIAVITRESSDKLISVVGQVPSHRERINDPRGASHRVILSPAPRVDFTGVGFASTPESIQTDRLPSAE